MGGLIVERREYICTNMYSSSHRWSQGQVECSLARMSHPRMYVLYHTLRCVLLHND